MFIAFSLLVIWILMSPFVPIQNPDLKVFDNIEVKNIVDENSFRKSESDLGIE